MSIISRIDEDIKKALKAGEKDALAALRGRKSDIKYKQIEKGEELVDDDVIAVLNSARKKRRDSIEQFEKGGRPDLVEKELAEITILESYLPEQLTEDALRTLVREAVAECGAQGVQQMGVVMKCCMTKVAGRSDGAVVSSIVKQELQKLSS